MGFYPLEWPAESLAFEDFLFFHKSFARILLQLLPFAEGPVWFFDPAADNDESLSNSDRPRYWNKYIKRAHRTRRTVLATEKPVLFMPAWYSGNVVGIAAVEGLEAQFVNDLSEEWLLDRSRIASREFFLQKQLYCDPATAMFNGRFFIETVESLLNENAQQEHPPSISLFLIEIHPRANNAEKAIHAIIRAGYHLESFLGQDLVHHLGNGVFGLARQDIDEEQAQKLGKNLLSWFRREGFGRIHIGINTVGDGRDVSPGGLQPESGSAVLLERTWKALRKASMRGPYALCTYNSISNPDIHPLKNAKPAVLGKLKKIWADFDRFALLLLSRDKERNAGFFPKRLLALLEAEVPAVPLNENEVFIFLKDTDARGAKTWLEDFKAKLPDESDSTYSAGVAVYPCVDFRKSDIALNARKALLHAGFFGPDSMAVFDGVSLNVSGDVYYGEGDLVRAVKEYTKGLEIDPSNINLLNSLGEAYARMDKPRKARPFFEKILDLEPKHFMGLFNLGITCLSMGENEQAIRLFEKILAYSRGSLEEHQLNDLLLQLSKLYCRTGRHGKAVALLEREKIPDDKGSRAPGRGVLLRYLGEAYFAVKKHEKAIMTLQRAVRYNPHDPYSLSMLGELYDIEGQGDDIALSLCLQAVEIDGRNPDQWFRLAKVRYKMGQFSEALEAVLECLQRDRKHLEALQIAGRIYENMGLPTKAAGMYKKILIIVPGHKIAAAAMKNIKTS